MSFIQKNTTTLNIDDCFHIMSWTTTTRCCKKCRVLWSKANSLLTKHLIRMEIQSTHNISHSTPSIWEFEWHFLLVSRVSFQMQVEFWDLLLDCTRKSSSTSPSPCYLLERKTICRRFQKQNVSSFHSKSIFAWGCKIIFTTLV